MSSSPLLFIPITIVFPCSSPGAQISSRLVAPLWQKPARQLGQRRGRQETLSKAASISGSLRSEQPDLALDSASLPCSFLLSFYLKKKKKEKSLLSRLLSLHRPALPCWSSKFISGRGSSHGGAAPSSPRGLFPPSPHYTPGLTSPANRPSSPVPRLCRGQGGKRRHNGYRKMVILSPQASEGRCRGCVPDI